MFNRSNWEKEFTHLCVHAARRLQHNGINEHFLQARVQVAQKFWTTWSHFRLSVMSDERVPLTCGWKHPLRQTTIFCVDCVKKSARNVCRTRPARRRESHPLFRLLSAHPIVMSDIFDKITSHNETLLNSLLFNCCNLIERMIYGLGTVPSRSSDLIWLGNVIGQ